MVNIITIINIIITFFYVDILYLSDPSNRDLIRAALAYADQEGNHYPY